MNAVSCIPLGQASGPEWSAIRRPDLPLLIHERDAEPFAKGAAMLLGTAPFTRSGAGSVTVALRQLGQLPPALRTDIAMLAKRFAAFMGTTSLRIRLEGVTGNACRKLHVDNTDLRLITTYFGPGTEYGDPLQRIPCGAVALFKGRLFAAGHDLCWHRSPQIEGTGLTRLVLVIDTPLDEARAMRASAMAEAG